MNRLALRFSILLLATWLLPGCPTKINPQYCAADTDCSSAEEFCDIQGMFGDRIANQCVRRGDCQMNSDCPLSTEPFCEPGIQTCRGCQTDMECAELNPATPTCNTGTGECFSKQCDGPRDCTDNAPVCSPERQCIGCSVGPEGDEVCSERGGDKPFCTPAGTCGECNDNTHCTADASKPICDNAAGICRGCKADSECADSEVCDLAAGSCATVDQVLYVATNGNDGGECEKAMPCATVGTALGKVGETRRFIRIANGIYQQALTIDGITVTIVGNGPSIDGTDGVAIQPAATELNKPTILVRNNGAVTLRGMQLQGAAGDANADGIQCTTSGTIALSDITVTDNANIGVDIIQCSLTIERSTISENRKGGISLSSSNFSITNSFIINNGDVRDSQLGGVRIENSGSNTPQIFSFNTVARNATAPVADASGVRCSTDTSMTASNNIVYEGFGGAPSIDGTCKWSYSNIEDSGNVALDGTNISEPPMFVDSQGGNFHLLPGSPCRNKADPASTITIDIDGDARPQEGLPDIGADELVPM